MSDFASDLRDFSLSTWAFRADLDCSSSKALSRMEILVRAEEEGRRGRAVEEERGVCLEAEKNGVKGEWKLLGFLEEEGWWCLGVLKLEMSLNREEEGGGGGGVGDWWWWWWCFLDSIVSDPDVSLCLCVFSESVFLQHFEERGV